MTLMRMWLGRVTAERTAALGVMLLLFITSLAVALAPRALEDQAGQALAAELRAATSIDRTLVILESAGARTRPPADWAAVTASATRLEEQMPRAVRRLVSERTTTLDTAYWQVFSGPAINGLLRMRLHDGAFERIRLVGGRLPTDQVQSVPDDRPSAAAGQRSNVYEALLPASAADRLGVRVGDRLPLETWRGDATNVGINLSAVLHLVGTYELAEPGSDFWVNDLTVGGWRIFTVGTNDYVETSALLAPSVHAALLPATHGSNMTLLYQYRYFTDTDRLGAADVGPTVTALRRLAGSVPSSGISDIPGDSRLNSGLLRLLESHQRMWQSVGAVLALVGIGVMVIAVASLAAVLVVASAGRVRVATLLRARGAGRREVLLPAAVELAAIVLPPALAALILAAVVLPGPSIVPGLVLVGTVAVLALLIGLWMVQRGAVGGAEGRPVRGRRLGARRLVLELCLAGGALVGAWLLRERGVNALGGQGSADPLVAAALALVGIAAGVIAIRLYPLPARLLGAVVAWRRDLLPVLAVRRAVRGGGSAKLLFLLVTTATVGTFASAATIHLDRSAGLGAWHEVGAEHRISSRAGALPAAFQPAALPGVEAHSTESLRLIQVGQGNAWLLSLDPADRTAVAAGTPAEVRPPAELSRPDADGRLPVLAGNLGLRPGDAAEARVDRSAVGLRVVGTANTFPGIAPGEAFVVVDRHHLADALGGRSLPTSHVLLRAAPHLSADLRRAAQAVEPALVVLSRADEAERVRAAPAMGALRTLMAAGGLLAIGYAAVAAAAALALNGAAQRDEIAHLRAMGLSRRGPAWLSLVEYGPTAIVGYIAGIALGLLLFQFLVPALGLPSITGSVLEVPVAIEPWHLAALLAAMLAILVVGWLASVLAQGDADPAGAIRRGVD
jgi:putative ABC transport system permease protein